MSLFCAMWAGGRWQSAQRVPGLHGRRCRAGNEAPGSQGRPAENGE